MRTRNRKRLVLLAGGLLILTGMLGLSLHSSLSAAGRDGHRQMALPAEGFGIERWKEELGLSEKQVEQLRKLHEELRRELTEKALAHAAIDLELSEKQVAALKALHEKHLEQREAMREKHREDLEALKEKTGLTDEQIAGLGMMAGEHRHGRPGMNLMHRGRGYGRLGGEPGEIRERLSKILTEEQIQKLDRLREERREMRCDEHRSEGRRGDPHQRPHRERDDW